MGEIERFVVSDVYGALYGILVPAYWGDWFYAINFSLIGDFNLYCLVPDPASGLLLFFTIWIFWAGWAIGSAGSSSSSSFYLANEFSSCALVPLPLRSR